MTPQEIFGACGVPTNRRNVVIICPVCEGGKTHEKSCSINLEKGLGKCWRSSCGWVFNAQTFYEKVNGKKLPGTFVATEVAEVEMASLEKRHSFYSSLSRKRGLIAWHKNDLAIRGFNVIPEGYFSTGWDYKEAMDLAEYLGDTSGIPGAFICKTGKPTLTQTKPGIGMPFKDENGKFQGVHIRKDDELRDEGEPKCLYFTSTGKTGGTGAKCWLHWSQPVSEVQGELYLTEGIMKADLAHELSGKPFIAVPGVNCLSELRKYLDEGIFTKYGIHTINICYDMDFRTNPGVLLALNKTKALIKKAGLKCYVRTWDERYKGIDDYLVSLKK